MFPLPTPGPHHLGLYVTVPCASTLNTCIRSADANTGANQCWASFWTCTKSGNAGEGGMQQQHADCVTSVHAG